MSDARAFAAVIRHAAADISGEAEKSLFKASMKIKADLQKELRASKHFKGIAPGITFDITGLSSEIGPEKGGGSPGALANVAYFGTSRGGGTVEDPEEALLREVPFFEKYLGEAAVRSFG